MVPYAFFLFLICLKLGEADNTATIEDVEIIMPNVQPNADDLYLCTAYIMPPDERYIVGFSPHGNMKTAHHILVYGCEDEPGSDSPAWNCGEMTKSRDNTFSSAPTCRGGSSIVYAWGRDAPDLNLPEGVGFKVEADQSGVVLHWTEEPTPRRAGVILLGTGGMIKANSKEDFDTACVNDNDLELHPFAFRTHAHERGKVVSGWRVREGQWTLIGKKNPLKPQMFYDVANKDMTINYGDVLAARCFMQNNEDHDIYIGSTGEDEMCNFYIMYWVEGDRIVEDFTCFSPGPPYYRWETTAGLSNIPEKETHTE